MWQQFCLVQKCSNWLVFIHKAIPHVAISVVVSSISNPLELTTNFIIYTVFMLQYRNCVLNWSLHLLIFSWILWLFPNLFKLFSASSSHVRLGKTVTGGHIWLRLTDFWLLLPNCVRQQCSKNKACSAYPVSFLKYLCPLQHDMWEQLASGLV